MSSIRDAYERRMKSRSGRVDPNTGAHRATPWVERTDDAIYTGLDGQVWMYRVLENTPLRYEDPQALLDHGAAIQTIINDIGQTSLPMPPGFQSAPVGFYRNIHILTVRWYLRPDPPVKNRNTPLGDYQTDELLNFTTPAQAVFFGVQLTDLDSKAAARSNNVFDFGKNLVNELFEDNPTDHDRYLRDREFVGQILSRAGCRTPRVDELRQLEAWFNHGSHAEPEIQAFSDHLIVDREDRLEFAALERFNQSNFEAPHTEWIADVMDHADGPAAISIRAELQPAVDTRKMLRKSMRKRTQEDNTRMNAGQDERVEQTEEDMLTRLAEAQISRSDAGVTLRNTSIIFGRRDHGYSQEDYIDYLRHEYSVDVKPLTHRQIWALEETMPCSQKRANPFPQHLFSEVAAYAGLGMFTELGDDAGPLVGRGLPDGTPVYFDPLAASRYNLPPATGIFGTPGSGKSQTLDSLVLTPTGWRRMGDLKVSDEVTRSDGRTGTIEGVFPQGVRPIYTVTMSDETTFEVDAEHYLITATKSASHKHEERGWERLTSLEVKQLVESGTRQYLPSLNPVEFHVVAPLPLDPYLLGLLIGDGGFTGEHPTLATEDHELVEAVRKALPDGLELVKDRRSAGWCIVSVVGRSSAVTGMLNEHGINGLTRRDMYIPDVITNGDDETKRQFLAVLAMLMTKSTQRNVWKASVASEKVRDQAVRIAEDIGIDLRHQPSQRTLLLLDDDAQALRSVTIPAERGVLSLIVLRGTTKATTGAVRISGLLRADRNDELFDIAEQWMPEGWTFNRDSGDTVTIGADRTNPLVNILDELGLWGKKSERRHIPGHYLYASIAAREALMQGLMDADGMVGRHDKISSTAQFGSSSGQLFADVRELVGSLGGYITKKVSTPTYRRIDDPAGAPYRGYLRLPEGFTPFRMKSKADLYRFNPRTVPCRHIVSIDYLKHDEAQCIKVSADDALYVTDGHNLVRNTYLASSLAYQACLGGLNTAYINPKGMDSLYPLAEFMASKGIPVEWVAVSRLADSGGQGTYDPFRYAQTPETAAMIAANLITTVLDFTQEQRTALRHGLTIGAKNGARCSMQALGMVTDEYVVRQVMTFWEATPLFQLALGMNPKPRMDGSTKNDGPYGKFILTEFDIDMNLPTSAKDHYTDAERIGLAAVRAVTTAQVGMLAGTNGGMMMVDEAHAVLGHPDTVHMIQKLMREGRSLNVAQVYMTQMVSDLISVGGTGASMESYLSRVFALRLTDPEQARAALQLLGYEPTQERIDSMRGFGSKRLEDGTVQPAFGYYRDLMGRKSIVSLGPVGADFAAAASTNIDDRIARERAKAAGIGGHAA